MNTYKPGDLPEALKAWARFRPADLLDFGRRAKSLAAILDMPLQKTQDVYARACGYSGRHEVQQVLQQQGAPGPYDDVIPGDIAEPPGDVRAMVRFYRHERLMALISELSQLEPPRWIANQDALACDLALFSTSAAHRAAVRAVKNFLDGAVACTADGFPFGYHGVLHVRYGPPAGIDGASLAVLQGGCTFLDRRSRELIDPREQCRALRLYRAPQLFLAMVEDTAQALLLGPPELDLHPDLVSVTELDQLLLGDVDWHLAHLLDMRHDGETDDEEFDRLLAAVRRPDPRSVGASRVASSIERFADRVPLWRLSLRSQLASTLRDQSYDLLGDGSETTLLLEDIRVGDDGKYQWLTMCLRADDSQLAQTHYKVDATLLLADDRRGPWTAAALVTGDMVIASRDGKYDSPEYVLSYYDDCGHGELYLAWELLTGLYQPTAGYLSHQEWIDDLYEGGGALTVLQPWVAPAYRGTNVSFWLFRGFVSAFDDGMACVTDSDWRAWTDPRSGEPGDDMWESDDEEVIMAAGVVFVSLPGSRTLGYSVYDGQDDEGKIRLLRSKGQRLGRRARHLQAREAGGVGTRLLGVLKHVASDFVLFDPDDDMREHGGGAG